MVGICNCYQTMLLSLSYPYQVNSDYKFMIDNSMQLGIISGDNLEWDTKVLGVPCARLNFLGVELETQVSLLKKGLYDIIKEMKSQGIRLCDCRVDLNSYTLIHLLEEAGFRLMDVLNIYWVTGKSKTQRSDIVSCNKFFYLDAEQIKQIKQISNNSFVFSRIHQDPKISIEDANHFYNMLLDLVIGSDNSQIVLATDCLNNVVGYLIGKHTTINDKKILNLWMIAIDKKLRGKGIGAALLNYFININYKAYDYIEIGTQVNNISANALYAKNKNISLVANVATLHLWL